MKMKDLRPQHLGATIYAAGSTFEQPMLPGVLTRLEIAYTVNGTEVSAAYLDWGSELYADEELELVPDGS